MRLAIQIDKKYFILLISFILVVSVVSTGVALNLNGAWHDSDQLDWSGFSFSQSTKNQLKGDKGVAGADGSKGPRGSAGSGALAAVSCKWEYSDWACSYTVSCPSGKYVAGVGTWNNGACPRSIYCCNAA